MTETRSAASFERRHRRISTSKAYKSASDTVRIEKFGREASDVKSVEVVAGGIGTTARKGCVA